MNKDQDVETKGSGETVESIINQTEVESREDHNATKPQENRTDVESPDNNESGVESQTVKNKKRRKRIRKNKTLTVAAVNIRGVKGKIRSLESLLDAYKIDIVLISETMLKNNEQLNIKGYKWVGKNRRNRNGGGVGILISSKYAGSTTEITHLESNENLEAVWIRLET